MINIEGNWSGRITGTNNGNIFIEIKQDSSILSGIARLNDPVYGLAVYVYNGNIGNNDNIILNMKPDPVFFNTPKTEQVVINNQTVTIALPAATGYGDVTVIGKLVDEGSIEGTWSSTVGTGGNFFINNANKMSSEKNGITKSERKKSIFISYSHEDKDHLKRLHVHLRPLEKEGLVDIWDDTKIKAGEKWEEEINKALADAAIAVLIISADFLASEFIVDNELPPILEKAELDGTRIVPIVLKPCRFSRDKNLSRFQALNTPEEPLLSKSDIEQEKIWDSLSHIIESELHR